MTDDGRKKLCIAGIVTGAVIGCGSPFIGLAGTVWGMVKAFRDLGTSGVGDPSHLSAAIGEVLISTVAGAVIAIPGFILMIVSIVRLRRVERSNLHTLSHAAP